MKSSKSFLLTETAILIVAVICVTSAFLKAENVQSKEVDISKTAVFSDTILPDAQIPVLKIGGKESSEVALQSLDIQVEVTGNIATTRYTMVFQNKTSKILEGELLFPLPDGVSVSSYAIDINGKMRDAVPVEKAKAVQVFEEIEQRRIDPGLLEKVEGNNYRTRIYPIPANGTRTVSIGYEEEMSAEKGLFYYRLPMAYKEAFEDFSVKATVWKSTQKPIVPTSGNEIQFDKAGENYVASFSRKNYQPAHALVFALPAPAEVPQTLMQSASGSYYFLTSVVPTVETRKKQWDNDLAIVWDCSLSGMYRNRQREFEVLDIIFKEKKSAAVHLYLLNNRLKKKADFQINNGDWTALKAELEKVIYDGGTNFSAINLKNISGNEILFFSDGISTLSDVDFLKNSDKKPSIHCIVSAAKADYSAMKLLAAQTNGKFININALSTENLKNELLNETLQYLGTEHGNTVREIYPSVAMPVRGNFSVAGITDVRTAELTLLFGYGNKVEKRIKVKLNAENAENQGNVYRIWAQKKIAELDLDFVKNKAELSELGQQFGIVTRNTSLIVLETLQDYIRYNITPPAELRTEFLQWRKGQDEQRAATEKSLLDNAVNAANDLFGWWKKDFTAKKPKYPAPDKQEEMEVHRLPELREERQTLAYTAPTVLSDEIVSTNEDIYEDAEVSNRTMEGRNDVALDAAVSVGYATQRRSESSVSANKVTDKKEPAVSQPTIKLTPIKQDNEYSKKLTGKTDEDYQTYLSLRADYINTPTYYFDMADWFFRLGDREKALCILTSVADIDLENALLYRLLGYRLKEYGEYALEAFICKKVIEWRPIEPQSYRDYALALADGGKQQAALDSLYSVLVRPFSQNIGGRSRGIEEVVVTELNQLIAKNPALNTAKIDKKLVQAMPVDIRVVINWNMNNTDIDLHVKDPNGEECYYSHRQTAIGGRISNDNTSGYGPEQFLLKRAVKGKYGVFVNYFGDTQVKAEGPSTIMAEIFTKYADKTEKREVVCLQLSKIKERKGGLVQVAEFEF